MPADLQGPELIYSGGDSNLLLLSGKTLGRAHRRSKCGLGQTGADLLILLLSVLVQSRGKHRLRRQGEPVGTSCSTEEEEGPGVCSIIGWAEGTPNLQRAQSWAHTKGIYVVEKQL